MSARTALRCSLAFFAALLVSVSANAQLFRAYLAIDGNDANPCTLPAPCRLLPAALAAVADGGEIWMLDSANYNTATVTVGKSVSILAVPGAVGSVLAIGGPAISITAGGLKVALRNLVIVPLAGGGGTSGVSMTGASTLTIEDSLIANLPGDNVYVVGESTVKIVNTTIRNSASRGVLAIDGPKVTISGSRMLANNFGGVAAYAAISPTATTNVLVSDSVISGGSEGVWAYAIVSGATARVSVTRSTIDGTTNALQSITTGVGTAAVVVSNSTITNNANAWVQGGAGSIIQTLGNNHIRDNAATSGNLTPVGLQ